MGLSMVAIATHCYAAPADTQENPELIWNDESREKVCDMVKRLADRSVQCPKADFSPPCPLTLPPNSPRTNRHMQVLS